MEYIYEVQYNRLLIATNALMINVMSAIFCERNLSCNTRNSNVANISRQLIIVVNISTFFPVPVQ
jgi:hypothetical protein